MSNKNPITVTIEVPLKDGSAQQSVFKLEADTFQMSQHRSIHKEFDGDGRVSKLVPSNETYMVIQGLSLGERL